MKYVALLRGINVGGNNIIKMTDLRSAFQRLGFLNVETYIQSGNVIFDAPQTSNSEVTALLELSLSKLFEYVSRVVVRTQEEMEVTIAHMPTDWTTSVDMRKYVAFLTASITPKEVVEVAQLQEGVDFISTGPGCVYLSTLQEGITKSKFNKLIGKKQYKEMTIRNLATTQKIVEMMQAK